MDDALTLAFCYALRENGHARISHLSDVSIEDILASDENGTQYLENYAVYDFFYHFQEPIEYAFKAGKGVAEGFGEHRNVKLVRPVKIPSPSTH